MHLRKVKPTLEAIESILLYSQTNFLRHACLVRDMTTNLLKLLKSVGSLKPQI
jgi:hypothetical protein